ncbi:MAG: M48 family metallopeptidase [Candidatus Obscuribacterales bacterium]
MNGYVQRINQDTFRVDLGRVMIVPGFNHRLARLDLTSRTLVFSLSAVDHLTERCRRYFVIHQLAHFLEPSHSARFFELVSQYEPNHRALGKRLVLSARRNALEELLSFGEVEVRHPETGRLRRPRLLLSGDQGVTGISPLPGGGPQKYCGGGVFDCLLEAFLQDSGNATAFGGVHSQCALADLG